MWKAIALALTLLAGPFAWAEKDFSSLRKFTEGRLIAETKAVTPGLSGQIGLFITLADGWHTYWVNPGDSGAAINLTFRPSPGVTVKTVRMPVPERNKSGPLISFAYSKEVLFPIEIEVAKNVLASGSVRVEVDAEWLVCEDVCIPAIDTLSLEIPVGPAEAVLPSEHFGLFQKTMAHMPQPAPQEVGLQFNADGAELRIRDWPEDKALVDFFPFRGSGVTNDPPVFERQGSDGILKFKKSSTPQANAQRIGVLIRADKQGVIEALQFGSPSWSFSSGAAAAGQSADWSTLLFMLLSAFLGGMILNLMPCVFPILSIKLLSLMKVSKKSAAMIRAQNMGYVSGVVLSFLAIGGSLALFRNAGQLIGWGFQLQSPVFLAVLSWLFLALALNLLGVFEIDFIDSGLGGRWTRLGGFWGSFFTGILAVVVASPCTAPFMGVALGFGLSQSTPVLLAIFASLGLGLASPYLLMILVPSALWFLPKPGPWMITLKKWMALPLLLTIVWLLWVFTQIVGATALIYVLAGAVAVLVAVFVRTSRRIILTAAVLVWLGLGLKIKALPLEGNTASHGDWIPYSESLSASFSTTSTFVNFTADWCLTCKVNERLIFNDPEVVSLLKKKNVQMVLGDWTKPSAEITSFLKKYDRAGVPFYVIFSPRNPQGRVLPEVMTKSTFIEIVNEEFPQ